MMNEELLLRFLTKTCTQEELGEVAKWISEDKANADWLFGMEDIWTVSNPDWCITKIKQYSTPGNGLRAS